VSETHQAAENVAGGKAYVISLGEKQINKELEWRRQVSSIISSRSGRQGVIAKSSIDSEGRRRRTFVHPLPADVHQNLKIRYIIDGSGPQCATESNQSSL